MCGIANRKNELFEVALKKESVEVFEGTVEWICRLRKAGLKIAVVSSSSHCKATSRMPESAICSTPALTVTSRMR